jgi:hypothetical protein
MIPFAEIDPEFAKAQILLFLREWYMHPNGQIPAYEFAFSDVNPPVHAWAAWQVYKRTGPPGKRDRVFLARVFQKLMLNFTWWVNRKDVHGDNVFSGGFLGLDNIGVFDRSQTLPTGGHLEQADGTAWMAFFCSTMLSMALELARQILCGGEAHDGKGHGHCLLAIPTKERLIRILAYLLDENEFLSPYGIRSLSRIYRDDPYVFRLGNGEYRVEYVPGESTTGLFGGNSNWRGPIWFPVNYLLIEALERYHHFYGDTGRGVGASHQTGWTALVVNLLKRVGIDRIPDQAI